MSDLSRKARKDNRAKAQRLVTDPKRKVDASSWTPPEPLNTTIKTGARPVRPRIYKSGGRVQGDRARRADKLPREIADAQSTRNTVNANKEEFGSAHVGGYKAGGKANYLGGTRPTGGRIAKASGGRAKGKGKTNINIVIGAPGGQQPQQMPPQGVVRPPVPPQMPMGGPGMPPPGLAGAGGPPPGMPPPPGPGGPPMPRKRGGRTSAAMSAGSLSGEGRLQKKDIQRNNRKTGGKVIRSPADLTAGAMSGEGRIQKSEMQARNR